MRIEVNRPEFTEAGVEVIRDRANRPVRILTAASNESLAYWKKIIANLACLIENETSSE